MLAVNIKCDIFQIGIIWYCVPMLSNNILLNEWGVSYA